MRGYKLTGRGWVLAVVSAVLLSLGAYSLASLAFGDGGTPSPSPRPVPTGAVGSDSTSPPVEGNGTPPPPGSSGPSEPQAPGISATPMPSGTGADAGDGSPQQQPLLPGTNGSSSTPVVFLPGSAEMEAPVRSSGDIASLLPSGGGMDGYLVVVTSYTVPGEVTPELAGMRAEAVYNMLLNLGVPAQSVRTVTQAGTDSHRHKVDVDFLYVGDK